MLSGRVHDKVLLFNSYRIVGVLSGILFAASGYYKRRGIEEIAAGRPKTVINLNIFNWKVSKVDRPTPPPVVLFCPTVRLERCHIYRNAAIQEAGVYISRSLATCYYFCYDKTPLAPQQRTYRGYILLLVSAVPPMAAR